MINRNISLKQAPQVLLLAGLVLVMLASSGCKKERIRSYSFTLLTQDSTTVRFPQDFGNRVLVIGYIYTHCPDVCPTITNNMKRAYHMIGDTSRVWFIEISFDPTRDTPHVLRQYASTYHIDAPNWSFFTGNPDVIDSLLTVMGVVTQRSYTRFDEQKNPYYFINHTDRITLIDRKGTIVKHLPGSQTPPEKLAEEIRRLL